ncbi:MAG: cytochrome c3 family protein, partial [Phycisphaerae bacterium]|nr:cytochrome c3 family protein [Phycisphaerae bacterium]
QIYGGDGATFPVDEALDQKSILCMSCHDGTVAVDAFGGLGGTFVIAGRGNLGTDLQNDHPVGRAAVYPTHAGYFDPATWENTAGFGFALADMDVDGELERVVSCATCHEPHNRNDNEFFLWVDNDGSQLCLTCHNK